MQSTQCHASQIEQAVGGLQLAAASQSSAQRTVPGRMGLGAARYAAANLPSASARACGGRRAVRWHAPATPQGQPSRRASPGIRSSSRCASGPMAFVDPFSRQRTDELPRWDAPPQFPPSSQRHSRQRPVPGSVSAENVLRNHSSPSALGASRLESDRAGQFVERRVRQAGGKPIRRRSARGARLMDNGAGPGNIRNFVLCAKP